ncbi:hypothetical protein [Undibacterium sp.]|jgi:hypothetical protein|uniref:glycine-rich domain-containing protein n=1 Tax=Undibacterium sp. TaxID=1914977 RepID=UPI002C1E00C2|nr:hypothetical protein [Undibacterium sp.]HTD06935.1 hypothetical protein [Undibacterium sp.]
MTTAQQRTTDEIVASIWALDLEPIKFKLMAPEGDDKWSRQQADMNELGYRRFLTLIAKYPEASFAPNKDVDKFWHGHILDTLKYAEDCQTVFGYFLHHFPYLGLRGEEDAAERLEAAKTMERIYMKEFGVSCFDDADSSDSAEPAYSGPVSLSTGEQIAYSGAVPVARQTQVAYSGAVPANQAAYSGAVPGRQVAYSGAVPVNQAAYSGAVPARQVAYSGAVPGMQAAYSGAVPAGQSARPDASHDKLKIWLRPRTAAAT